MLLSVGGGILPARAARPAEAVILGSPGQGSPDDAGSSRIIRVSAAEEAGCSAPIGSGQQILTGVLGDASFYIEQPAFDRYVIGWATDGGYDGSAEIGC